MKFRTTFSGIFGIFLSLFVTLCAIALPATVTPVTAAPNTCGYGGPMPLPSIPPVYIGLRKTGDNTECSTNPPGTNPDFIECGKKCNDYIYGKWLPSLDQKCKDLACSGGNSCTCSTGVCCTGVTGTISGKVPPFVSNPWNNGYIYLDGPPCTCVCVVDHADLSCQSGCKQPPCSSTRTRVISTLEKKLTTATSPQRELINNALTALKAGQSPDLTGISFTEDETAYIAKGNGGGYVVGGYVSMAAAPTY